MKRKRKKNLKYNLNWFINSEENKLKINLKKIIKNQ